MRPEYRIYLDVSLLLKGNSVEVAVWQAKTLPSMPSLRLQYVGWKNVKTLVIFCSHSHRQSLASAINRLKPCLDDPGDIPGSQLKLREWTLVRKKVKQGRSRERAKPLKFVITPKSHLLWNKKWKEALCFMIITTADSWSGDGQQWSKAQHQNKKAKQPILTQLFQTGLKQNRFDHVCLSLPQTLDDGGVGLDCAWISDPVLTCASKIHPQGILFAWSSWRNLLPDQSKSIEIAQHETRWTLLQARRNHRDKRNSTVGHTARVTLKKFQDHLTSISRPNLKPAMKSGFRESAVGINVQVPSRTFLCFRATCLKQTKWVRRSRPQKANLCYSSRRSAPDTKPKLKAIW